MSLLPIPPETVPTSPCTCQDDVGSLHSVRGGGRGREGEGRGGEGRGKGRGRGRGRRGEGRGGEGRGRGRKGEGRGGEGEGGKEHYRQCFLILTKHMVHYLHVLSLVNRPKLFKVWGINSSMLSLHKQIKLVNNIIYTHTHTHTHTLLHSPLYQRPSEWWSTSHS